MSTGTKRPLDKALRDAQAFRDLFPNCYVHWEIAGSVRRCKHEVGDVEHVVVPIGGRLFDRMEELLPDDGLFGKPGVIEKAVYGVTKAAPDLRELGPMDDEERCWHGDATAAAIDQAMSEPVAVAVNRPTHRWGPKYRGVIFNKFRHEVFIADERNFGSVLAIRTGPAEFSKQCVTDMQRLGFYHREGRVVNAMGDIIDTPTEERFFELCGMRWIDPSTRGEPQKVEGQ